MTTPFTLHLGDCLNTLRGMPENSIDAIVTDPPYGLGKEPDAMAMLHDWLTEGHHDVKGRGFMGKEWDAFVPQPVLWKECLRVLKPGGHLLAFGGSRTFDLVCLGLRIAGFEMRDTLMWVYGQGFPKSLDVSKAIDAAAGAEREVVGYKSQGPKSMFDGVALSPIRLPVSLPAKHWSGFGTALKPAHEPICLARRPLDGTVAANVLRWGTGALNIDGCRVATEDSRNRIGGGSKGNGGCYGASVTYDSFGHPAGRWPANLCHDGSDEVVGLFPNTAPSKGGPKKNNEFKSVAKGRDLPHITFNHADDGGSAARFFYSAKASQQDRHEGCEHLPRKAAPDRVDRAEGSAGMKSPRAGAKGGIGANHHATVKPTALMRWLVRLVTPPGGVVLDPFTGSGSTGKAAILEGFRFIGCEMEAEYIAIAEARCKHAAMSIGEPIEDEPTPGGTEQQGNLLSLMDI